MEGMESWININRLEKIHPQNLIQKQQMTSLTVVAKNTALLRQVYRNS